MHAAPGTLLGDRYLVGEEIGRGGMGAVYRATDLRTGGPVAIKVLHPAYAGDRVYRERLRREAQSAALLSSPRVVRVVDLDVSGASPYLVMEYVAGETLQERPRREGRLAPAAALSIVRRWARSTSPCSWPPDARFPSSRPWRRLLSRTLPLPGHRMV